MYTRQAEMVFSPGPTGIAVLAVPSAPVHWTVAEVLSRPISTNSVLGTFTHFGNVLDLNAVAVPAGDYTGENSEKLPFGITLLGGSRTDAAVLEIARRFEEFHN